ncbi:ORF130 [White spot syndrome virus]|uniref:ORF130 n=1 Tax=White spot syndrome virus TaxID=342409 RepID=A0A2D3I612_9VIRU|nr:ORF130 [White spot syndrome virus]
MTSRPVAATRGSSSWREKSKAAFNMVGILGSYPLWANCVNAVSLNINNAASVTLKVLDLPYNILIFAPWAPTSASETSCL